MSTKSNLVATPITREALIDKLIGYRAQDWSNDDTEDMLLHGRIGFNEMANVTLEEIANDDYMLNDDDGNDVRYTITNPCPIASKPPVDEINKELLEALREMALLVEDFMPNIGNCCIQNYKRLNEAPISARTAIAKAEGRA